MAAEEGPKAQPASPRRRWCAAGALAGLFAVAAVNVWQTAAGSGPGFEWAWLRPLPGHHEGHVVLLSKTSVVLMTLAGIALLGVVFRPAGWVAAASGVVGLFVVGTDWVRLLGVFYSARLFYDEPGRPANVLGSSAWVCAGLGLIAVAGKQRLPLSLFAGASHRARLLRAFIPATLLLLMLGEILPDLACCQPFLGFGLCPVLHVLLPTAIMLGLLTLAARYLGPELDAAQTSLREARDELEFRVAARTAELATRNADLEREIARRQSMEVALLESSENFSALGETVPAIIFLHREGQCLYVNQLGLALLGYSRAEFVQRPMWELIREDYREPVRQRTLRRQKSGSLPGRDKIPLVRQDGQTVWVESAARDVTLAGQPAVLVCALDVTEQQRLQQLVADVSAREQQRLGQDLHDGLGQRLAGTAFHAKCLEQALTTESPAHAPLASELVQLIQQASLEAHTLAHGLAPAELDRVGLVPALARLVSEAGKAYSTDCQFQSNVTGGEWDPAVKLHLFRIVQEAFNNALKHARARAIQVELALDAQVLRLTVRDDGQGLAARAPASDGMGLRIMHSRAEAIGAALQMGLREGGGTEVCCTLPISRLGRPSAVNAGTA